MTSASDVRQMVAKYATEEIDEHTFHNWLAGVLDGEFADVAAEQLADKIEGLLAEASHSHWTEHDIREELANAIRPAVSFV
jgi:uncharacterized membrane-anchored protein YjiN (DUF445 family)